MARRGNEYVLKSCNANVALELRMKALVLGISSAFLVSGCATGPLTPTRIANGARSGMWTSRPALEVQACIDREVAKYPSSTTRFSVASNNTSKTVYATTVSVFDNNNFSTLAARVAVICTGIAENSND